MKFGILLLLSWMEGSFWNFLSQVASDPPNDGVDKTPIMK